MATYKTLSDGSVGQVIARSAHHGKKIFIDSNYRLSPKYGFLFYVEFDFNPLITNISNQAAQEMGMIVKSASLPKFTMDTKVHNAYNRVNIVQNKIKYEPVNIVFHDDQSDNIRNFWYDYYSFFFRDPDYADSTYGAIHKYQSRPSFDWGYSPRPPAAADMGGANNRAYQNQSYQYIQAIRIYSLYQQQFSEYELINPIITSFKHGDHVNGENTSLLSHDMTVQYETVKYLTGSVTENTVGGFIDLHYDRSPSPQTSGATPEGSNSDVVTDLANSNTAIFGRTDVPNYPITLSGSFSVGSLLSATTTGSAATPMNSGGFSLPSLASLTQGVTNSTMVSQQLNAAGISILGGAASQVAGAITGGIAAGLGANGTKIIGLAASAIANPNAALKTVENMAIQYATGIIANSVNSLIAPLTTQLTQGLTNTIRENFTNPIASVWSAGTLALSQSVNNLSMGAGFVTNAQLAQQFTNQTGVYAVSVNAPDAPGFGSGMTDVQLNE